MSILVNKNTKVICQGFTGKRAPSTPSRRIAYGTKMVGGVTPGKGGTTHLGLPVFDTVPKPRSDRRQRHGDLRAAAGAADAILEAIDAEIPLIVCITEGIPVLDMVKVKRALDRLQVAPDRAELPGRAHAGRMQDRHHAGQHLQEGQGRHRLALGHADL
jgi:succinyl-CoA synthetase alpha subunit